jgi:hypothetical protein
MALKHTLTLEDNFGVSCQIPDAYVQVYEVEGSKVNALARYFVRTQRDGNVLARKEIAFVPAVELGAPNFIAQAYEHMKTLPEFAGAVDC